MHFLQKEKLGEIKKKTLSRKKTFGNDLMTIEIEEVTISYQLKLIKKAR